MAKDSKQYSNLFYSSIILKVVTGSIALSASRRYLIYSEADFEVFRLPGATRCTDGVKFGMGEETVPNFTPSVQQQGCRTPKTEICTQNRTKCMEYKGVSLARFSQICRVCTPLQDALAVKIWLDLLDGLLSYGGFKLRGLVSPKFSVPPLAAKLCIRLQKVLEVQERVEVLYHYGGARISPAAGVAKNVEFFVCLFVSSSCF